MILAGYRVADLLTPGRGQLGKSVDRLTLFGLFAVITILVCYALEDRALWFIFAFAVACTKMQRKGGNKSCYSGRCCFT